MFSLCVTCDRDREIETEQPKHTLNGGYVICWSQSHSKHFKCEL